MKLSEKKSYFRTLDMQLTNTLQTNYSLIDGRVCETYYKGKDMILIDLTGSFLEGITDSSLIRSICSALLDTYLKSYNKGLETGVYQLQTKLKNLLGVSEFNPTHYNIYRKGSD